jgi:hypothetical protein
MKYLKLFEDWSPNFNRTLQGAYGKAQSTNKGFGKAAKAIIDYANKSISKKVFKLVTKTGTEVDIAHHPEFILKPIDTFKKYNGELSGYKNFIVIPIKILQQEAKERLKNLGIVDFDLLFKDGKIYALPTKRETSDFPVEEREVRFLSRVDIEDFFAMFIQAVLSSPEESDDDIGWYRIDKNLPGDTTEKQFILQLIQRLIFDKDQRQYTM